MRSYFTSSVLILLPLICMLISGCKGTPSANSGNDGEDGIDGVDGGCGDITGDAQCPAEELVNILGCDRLVVGGQMDDASFAAAKPDIRYNYVTGGAPADGIPALCSDTYDMLGGSQWYGCWFQSPDQPPGQWIEDFLTQSTQAGAIPLLSHYQLMWITGGLEGEPALAALTDKNILGPLMVDFEFLVEHMDAADVQAILHIEPDLWGFARQGHDTPQDIPVAMNELDIDECNGFENNLAGLGKCMVAIVRAKAPKVLIGLHFTGWTAHSNSDPEYDVIGDADDAAAFMKALGAGDTDLIIVEMSNCDAGQTGRWWDETNETLPNFTQALTWAERVSEQMEMGHLWWQIPYGHMDLDETYRDNRLDYFFDHPDEFAAAQSIGIVFGTGCGGATMPDTDDNHFIDRITEYKSSKGTPLCGP